MIKFFFIIAHRSSSMHHHRSSSMHHHRSTIDHHRSTIDHHPQPIDHRSSYWPVTTTVPTTGRAIGRATASHGRYSRPQPDSGARQGSSPRAPGALGGRPGCTPGTVFNNSPIRDTLGPPPPRAGTPGTLYGWLYGVYGGGRCTKHRGFWPKNRHFWLFLERLGDCRGGSPPGGGFVPPPGGVPGPGPPGPPRALPKPPFWAGPGGAPGGRFWTVFGRPGVAGERANLAPATPD